MEIEILNSPGNATAKVSLEGGEEIVAESGAMIAMDGNIQVTTSTKKRGGGGILKALKRLLAGESFFINTFTAPPEGGTIYFGTALLGDMMTYTLQGTNNLMVQGTSFVACAQGVDMDTTWQGFTKALFSGESMFWIKLSGQGEAILNSFGGIYEKEIDGTYIVDTGHIVAFEDTLQFHIRKAGSSWLSAILGGEGLVCEFHGKGRVFCQTHNANNFGWTLSPLLKPR